MLALLEFLDFGIIGVIVIVLGGAVASSRTRSSPRTELWRVERKLDLILNNLGLEFDERAAYGSEISAEARSLADQGQKLMAIKAHREQTGLGLKESKDAIDAYLDSGRH